jgi:hypothetical protein
MDIFFQDPNEIPLPPAEVRILEFRASPYPDGRRVRVYLEVTPFQKRPNVDVSVDDKIGNTAAEVSIIETMTRKMEFTIHLRVPKPEGTYSVDAVVYYKPVEENPGADAGSAESEKLVVDRRQIEFTLPDLAEESLSEINPPPENPAG